MANYDHFARFYDLTMDERPDAMDTIDQALAIYAPKAITILELGCGTGNALAQLRGDFELTGIDTSSEMLHIARRKVPSAHLQLGDITNFDLGHHYDVIICIFDTINHLSSLKAWEKMFELTTRHLGPAGLFIFDMNTIGRLKRLPEMGQLIHTAGDITIEMAVTPAGREAVDWHITIQEPGPDGIIQTYEDSARERSYPLKAVTNLVEQHFELLSLTDADDAEPSDNSDRLYFVCRAKHE